MRATRIGSASILAAACASSAPSPRAAPPEPAPVVTTSAAPSPPPAARTTHPGPPPAIVAEAPALLTDPEQREAFHVLAPLCEATVGRDFAGTLRAGCTCCAPFDECPPKPGVAPALTDTTALVRGIAFGSFTRPAAEEAALSMDGCESHAENYGGTVLAEKATGGWRLERYDSGNHPDRLRAYRMPDGRDLFVGEWADAHQTWFDRIYVTDLAAPDAEWTTLVELHDDTTMACIDKRPGVWGAVDEWTFVDVNRDGTLELRIRARAGKAARYSGAFAKRCAVLMASMDKDGPGPGFGDVVGARRLELVFRFDGKTFVPTPPTERLLEQAGLR